jgi:trehalose/maltose transport system substrate-binding protein
MRAVRSSIFRRKRLAVIALVLIGIGGCRSNHVERANTLKYLQDGWVQPADMPALRVLSEDFARQTGINLEVIRGVPAEPFDQLSLIRKLLHQRADGPDVVEADVAWLGAINEDVIDLRPYLPSEAGSLSPLFASSYIIGGKLLALPHHNEAGALAYRADLLRKYGYSRPPQTWDELETMALRIQAGERARGNKDFWGYVWPGAAEESLTCNALEWQAGEGGGRIIESDDRISVNNPAAIRAWERARHWIGWISPPSVKEYRESDSYHAFESGQSAFLRVWVNEAGVLSTRERPELRGINWWNKPSVGEAGFTLIPAGSVARTAVLGGSGLAISKYSTHPAEDAALIRFVLRKELESFEDQRRRSFSRQSVIYNATGLEESKNASPVDISRAIVIARPTNVSAEHYDQVSKAYSVAVHSVLAGDKNASDAASELEQDLVRITGLRTGPPTKE